MNTLLSRVEQASRLLSNGRLRLFLARDAYNHASHQEVLTSIQNYEIFMILFPKRWFAHVVKAPFRRTAEGFDRLFCIAGRLTSYPSPAFQQFSIFEENLNASLQKSFSAMLCAFNIHLSFHESNALHPREKLFGYMHIIAPYITHSVRFSFILVVGTCRARPYPTIQTNCHSRECRNPEDAHVRTCLESAPSCARSITRTRRS
jgi:hypothetical protein